MSQAAGSTNRTADPSLLPPRWARMLRSAVLLVAGIVITFSATMHEHLSFDLAVVAGALAAIGLVHVIEAWQRRGRAGLAVAMTLGVISVTAAVMLMMLGNLTAFAVVVAAWALASGLLEFLGAALAPGSRQDATLVGFAGLLLAVAALLARGDLVAVIGLFGAYSVIAGVFLGIAAFDTRRQSETEDVAQGTAVNA